MRPRIRLLVDKRQVLALKRELRDTRFHRTLFAREVERIADWYLAPGHRPVEYVRAHFATLKRAAQMLAPRR